VEVVGASYHREATQARYSSRGPTPSLPKAAPSRDAPDCLRPADTSRALRGITVAGSTGGQFVRVTGSSFAAPQRAREIVNS
jgi:subtilisin family serine protease